MEKAPESEGAAGDGDGDGEWNGDALRDRPRGPLFVDEVMDDAGVEEAPVAARVGGDARFAGPRTAIRSDDFDRDLERFDLERFDLGADLESTSETSGATLSSTLPGKSELDGVENTNEDAEGTLSKDILEGNRRHGNRCRLRE